MVSVCACLAIGLSLFVAQGPASKRSCKMLLRFLPKPGVPKDQPAPVLCGEASWPDIVSAGLDDPCKGKACNLVPLPFGDS